MFNWRRITKGSRGHPRQEIGALGQSGFGKAYHQAWEFRPLPGAGANQWAWETLALPMYTPIGAGTRNLRQFIAQEGGVMVALQGVTLTPISGAPVGGDLTGQITTQPLLDVTIAEQTGIQTPAYTPAPNQWEMPMTGATQ